MHPVTIGTAGHIDHGKSALVWALTGSNPDRLAEEQRRGMTIDLGFAHLDLPSGVRAGIVDVPGHEALVHNMLAGAGGIDLVMLVVAADAGVMPQTREHLDILRFLPITGGVVVLNKVDLAPDAEWLEIVREDVRSLVVGTVLEQAPIVEASAKTGAGLPELVDTLDRLVAALPPRPADGPVRLPVDRSFTIQGFGTVVTGTLWSGTVRPGDTLAILPSRREVRVRGVQVHGQPAQAAVAGSRVAVNLAGVEKEEVIRGHVLATPGAYEPTSRLDVRLRLLPDAPALKHAARAHVHFGSGVALARVALVDRPRLEPGDEALVQLRLDAPVTAIHGDRLVIRQYSPTRTIGGGVVITASPLPRRRGAQAARALEAVEREGPVALLTAAVVARGQNGIPMSGVASAAGLGAAQSARAVAHGQEEGLIIALGDRLYGSSVIEDVRRLIGETLAAYHRNVPWRLGMPREELKARVTAGAGDRVFDHVMSGLRDAGSLVDRRDLTALAEHEARLSETQQRARDALLEALERGGASPPSLDDLRRLAGGEVADRMLQRLLDEGLVTQVAPDLRFGTGAVEQVRQVVVDMLRAGGDVTVATVRDRLQTSRKYALALMEYLDAVRATRRVGDKRVLGPAADTPLTVGR